MNNMRTKSKRYLIRNTVERKNPNDGKNTKTKQKRTNKDNKNVLREEKLKTGFRINTKHYCRMTTNWIRDIRRS